MLQTGMAGPLFMLLVIMVDWAVYSFLISGEPALMRWTIQEIHQVMSFRKIHSTLDISKLKFIQNYWYLKVNFLVPENLLRDISSLR